MYGQLGIDLVVQFSVIQAIAWLTVLLFVLEFRQSRSDFPSTMNCSTSLVRDPPQVHSLESSQNDLEGKITNNDGLVDVKRPSLWSLMKVVGKKLLANPNSYSCIVGIVWALFACRFNFQIPSIVDGSILIMSKAGTGTAMLSMGMFMALQEKLIACGPKLTIFGMILKFVAGPAAMAIAALAVGLHGDVLRIAIIQTLGFDNSKNIFIDGLTSIDSQMFHVTINACQNIKITRMTITAHADSPNTDGIHIALSSGVTILDSTIKTGDDCISIGPNNQNLWIENIHCGPGHGISIGSLGREKSEEGVMVQNVMVKSVTFTGTSNGLRIKTFSTPVNGRVKDIFFLGAHMNNVQNPIIIDQNYCPHNSCPIGQGSGIQINNVVYKGIRGTSASKMALNFECSSKKPCAGLTLQDIKLSYHNEIPECEGENAYGKVIGFMQPSNCLGH